MAARPSGAQIFCKSVPLKYALNFFKSVNSLIFALPKNNCPGGEIGRRTVFRSQRGKPCAGSNPVPGTMPFKRSLRGIFIWMLGELSFPCFVA